MSKYISNVYPLELSKGSHPSDYTVSITGGSGLLVANADTDVWSLSADEATYRFSSGADIDSISSDDAGDNQTFSITGLDSNWLKVTQSITLSGTTRQALTTNLIRVNDIVNISSTDTSGDVYVYENTALTGGKPTDTAKIRSHAPVSHQSSSMGIYSIASNETAYFNGISVSLSRKQATVAEFSGLFRRFESVFIPKLNFTLNTVGTSYLFRPPMSYTMLPAKSDIKATVNADANNAGISLTLDLIILGN